MQMTLFPAKTAVRCRRGGAAVMSEPLLGVLWGTLLVNMSTSGMESPSGYGHGQTQRGLGTALFLPLAPLQPGPW